MSQLLNHSSGKYCVMISSANTHAAPSLHLHLSLSVSHSPSLPLRLPLSFSLSLSPSVCSTMSAWPCVRVGVSSSPVLPWPVGARKDSLTQRYTHTHTHTHTHKHTHTHTHT